LVTKIVELPPPLFKLTEKFSGYLYFCLVGGSFDFDVNQQHNRFNAALSGAEQIEAIITF
jgi:hypothetical protein